MALDCSLTNNILRTGSCDYVLQSVVDIYLMNKGEVSAVTVDAENTSISAISLDEAAKVYHIQPAKNTALFTDTLNVTDSGNRYRTHALSFSLSGKYDADMVKNLHALSVGEFIAVAKLASGDYIMLGDDSVGLQATSAVNTGAASATEASGISIEMSADLTVDAKPLTSEAITALLGKVVQD